MQIKNCLVLGFAASVFADCDPNDGSNQTDCSSSGTATRTVTSTSTDAAGVVITNIETTTDIGVSTTLVPVFTPIVETTTDVGVDTPAVVVTAVDHELTYDELADMLVRSGSHRIVVTKDGVAVGLITASEVLKTAIAATPLAVANSF